MGKVLQLFKNRNLYVVALSAVLSVVLVAVAVSGATTISTNISTDGTLTVTGTSLLTGAVNASSTVIATGRMQTFGQLVLQSSTSDPSGPIAGGLYYDSTNRVLKLYNGTAWFSVSSSTDASGGLILTDAVGVRFNTIATNYMALGTSTLPIASTTLSNSPVLFINSTTTASVPLEIVGTFSQTGDLIRAFQVTAAGHVEVFAVDAVGSASTTVLSTTGRVADALVISGYATTSGSTGNFATEGTLAVTGATTLTGALTANVAVTLGNAAADAIIITGNASTTNSLSVGTRGGLGVEFSVAGFATTTVNMTDAFATTTMGVNTEAGGGGALGIGTSTPTKGAKLGVVGDVTVSNTLGTTTLRLHAEQANFGSCIQLRATNGVMVRIYATSTPGTGIAGYRGIVVEAGECEKTLTSDVN